MRLLAMSTPLTGYVVCRNDREIPRRTQRRARANPWRGPRHEFVRNIFDGASD
jgi:hypothetical protein